MVIPERARISISNIAWPAASDEQALDLVGGLGFRGVELAPGKVFSSAAALDEARAYRARLAERGLEVVAFQALLFGDIDVALFGEQPQRTGLAEHLSAIARLAGAAGARACVFGSPGARRRGALSEDAAFGQAVSFFAELAPRFEAEGVTLAVEANAAHYGCDFLTATDQARALVEAVNRPGIGLQLDTGTLLLNGEPPEAIERAVPVAAHFHASEPDLAPLASPAHAEFGARLRAGGYAGWQSVEMCACADWPDAIRRAAALMAEAYA